MKNESRTLRAVKMLQHQTVMVRPPATAQVRLPGSSGRLKPESSDAPNYGVVVPSGETLRRGRHRSEGNGLPAPSRPVPCQSNCLKLSLLLRKLK